jgi:peptide subunit release factor 1 (eRF1)
MSLANVSSQLQRLTAIPAGKHPIVSCYLKLEPRDRARGKYLIKLKNRMKSVLEEAPALGYTREELKSITRDLDRIFEDLSRPGSLPPTQGIAIFASTSLKLYERVPVPMVYRSRLVLDRTPQVRQLLAAEDEVGRLLAVVMDRTSARLFEVTAYGADELADVHSGATPGGRFHSRRGDAPGWGEAAYHGRIRAERQRHLSAIAEALFDLDRKRPAHGVVLGGIGTDAAALESFLHPHFKARFMGTFRLPPKRSSAADVHLAVLEARSAWEATREEQGVRDLEDALGTGWAVRGVRDTLQALGEGKLRTLLVDPAFSAPGVRCASGALALSGKECRGGGASAAVYDVVDDAVEDALRQRIPVEVVKSPAAARLDGLAGTLRFR